MPDVRNRYGHFAPDPDPLTDATGRVLTVEEVEDRAYGRGPWGSGVPHSRYQRVGPFQSMAQCITCRTICMPDHEHGLWIGPEVDMVAWAMGPEDVPLPRHVYPFPGAADERVNDTLQDDPGPEPAPEVSTGPVRPVHPQGDPDDAVMDRAYDDAEAVEREYRAGMRANHLYAVAPALLGARDGKSRLGRTPEYRRIEKRRERARKQGRDPDTLGPGYAYPRRGSSRADRALAAATDRMLRAGRRAGLIDQDD